MNDECFNNHWTRCRNSRLWTSHYYAPYGYNDYKRGCTSVSRFDSYLITYIHKNGYHIETNHQNNEEFLLITKDNGYGRDILERIPSTSSRLYYSYIKPVQHVAYKVIFQIVNVFQTWLDHLGHPGIGMMRKITSNSVGHKPTNAKFSQSSDYTCTACATEKLILRPSFLKIQVEPLNFLERIQGDICGLINPLSGPFR